MKCFLITFLTVLTLKITCAQAPSKINYQSIIRNNTGALVTNTLIGVKISLLQSSSTGTVVFAERHTPTTNINGLANIEIGTGTNLTGSFANIDWANGTYFLKTETDITGGTNYTIVSTTQMLSVPYALYATNSTTAQNAWSITGNSIVSTNYLGTNNNMPLKLKVNNSPFGILDNANNGNVGIGQNTLISNTTGVNLVSIGSGSLALNTTGSGNTATGWNALNSNTIGQNNVAIGIENSRYNISGNSNSSLGAYALRENIGGGGNVAIGRDALRYNTSGNTNTAIGFFSLNLNSSGQDNVAIGSNSLVYNTTGFYNTSIGSNSGRSIPAGTMNTTCIGYNTGWNSTSDNNVNIGNFSITSIGGQVNWATYSDNRIKKNIQENVPGLAFITKLKPVTYNLDIKKQYKIAMNGREDSSANYEGKYNIENIKQSGFLAQDVEKAANDCNYSFSGVEIPENGKGLYKLRYAEFVIPLVKAVQEQQIQIEMLSNQNKQLLKRIEALETKNKTQ